MSPLSPSNRPALRPDRNLRIDRPEDGHLEGSGQDVATAGDETRRDETARQGRIHVVHLNGVLQVGLS